VDDHDHGRPRHRRGHDHLVADAALAALVGIALGAVTGMPIGVVNVAIVDAATRGQARFARGIGLGGALADAVHAGLAFVGVGQLVAAHPHVVQAMAIVAATLIAGYAVSSYRRPARTSTPSRARGGFVTGLVLTLPNPAALIAWIAVAAVLWPTLAVAPTVVPALALAVGVGIGSAAWFVLLAHLVSKLPAGGRIARYLPRVALAILLAIAAIGLWRAFAFA
jgi:threonine/homoserine/homoserine lactone efflux protein